METGSKMSTEKVTGQKVAILTIQEVKVVNKPWGFEKWIAGGKPDFPYALKEIFIRAPYQSSLQFHKDKQETNYVQKGKGFLHYSDERIDVRRYKDGGYSAGELNVLTAGIKKKELSPGIVFHVFPGFLHRVEAVEDLWMMESSTVELDDVYRLQDDAARPHGRIENEHR